MNHIFCFCFYQIFLSRPNSSALSNSTVLLTKDSTSLSQINVTDPELTILFNVEPSINVTLAVNLSYESPPNSTNLLNSSILTYSGNHH